MYFEKKFMLEGVSCFQKSIDSNHLYLMNTYYDPGSMLIQYLLYPLQQFYEVYTIYAFIVQKKKLKFREVKWLSQVHTAIKGRGQDPSLKNLTLD